MLKPVKVNGLGQLVQSKVIVIGVIIVIRVDDDARVKKTCFTLKAKVEKGILTS